MSLRHEELKGVRKVLLIPSAEYTYCMSRCRVGAQGIGYLGMQGFSDQVWS